MKKLVVISILVLVCFNFTGCGNSNTESIEPSLLVGTWQTENDMEKVTLELKENNTFIFIGTGFAQEEAGEVTLTETGEYEVDGNQLFLNIEDVQSSGLEYEDMVDDNLGTLTFYMELKEDNKELDLTERSGSISYNFVKQ